MATEVSVAGVIAMPYNRARKSVLVTIAIVAPSLNVDTANGRTKPVTAGDSARRVSPASIIAGSAASDERVLNPTTCARAMARAKMVRGTPPSTAATT